MKVKWSNAIQKIIICELNNLLEIVSKNISPSADRSYSSGLNGLDPEQMSEWQRMKNFTEYHRHLEYCFDCEPM